MTLVPAATQPVANLNTRTASPEARFARRDGRPQRNQPQLRTYVAAYLSPHGDIQEIRRDAPAHPVFAASFGALTRHALIDTPNGLVACGDLLPGDLVETSAGPQRILWKGHMPLANGTCTKPLIRISADAMGLCGPAHDLVLGPYAQVVKRIAPLADRLGTDRAFVPAADLVDGVAITQVHPHGRTDLYHLSFAKHCAIQVDGVLVQAPHPGRGIAMPPSLRAVYLSLFPHLSSLEGFGPACLPALAAGDLQMLLESA